MKSSDIVPGMQVRPVGYPQKANDRLEFVNADTPVMVVREVVVHCSWFVNGTQHNGYFRAVELEAVAS